MIEESLASKLKERYKNFHPLIFKLSCTYAKSPGELFDLLEDFPDAYPVRWSESERRWKSEDRSK